MNPIKLVVLPQQSGEASIQTIQLPHPKGYKAMFLTNGTTLLQLQKFENEYNSLAVDDFIVKDGSITTATLYDPIFILIPILDQSKMYKILSDILYDFDPESNDLHCLSKLSVGLSEICDSAVNDDEPENPYLKLNKLKALIWLKRKVDHLVSVLDQLQLFQDYKFSTSSMVCSLR
jgi:ribonuclease H2 subunit B